MTKKKDLKPHNNDSKSTSSQDSFLTDDQLQGKAVGGKVQLEYKSLDEAIASVHKVLDEDIVKKFHNTPEEKLPTCKIAIYSHEAQSIVPAGAGKTPRGKPRIVCGVTGSKKISMGREEALRKFYHLEKKE